LAVIEIEFRPEILIRKDMLPGHDGSLGQSGGDVLFYGFDLIEIESALTVVIKHEVLVFVLEELLILIHVLLPGS